MLVLLVTLSISPVDARPLRLLTCTINAQPAVMGAWASHEDSKGGAEEDAYPLAETMQLVEEDVRGTGYYDVYHYNTPISAITAREPELLQPMGGIIGEVKWGDILPTPRSLVQYNGELMAVPIDYDPWLTFYRTDLMDHAPETWDEFLQIADRFNGTDLNGDGEPDYGACIDSDFLSHFVMTVVTATTSYTDSKRDGMVWDLQDDDKTMMRSLMTKQPWFEAMETLRRLAPNTPIVTGKPVPVHETYEIFRRGRCAVTLSFPSTGSQANAAGAYIRGKLGASPPPGSRVVWDRVTESMVPCTVSRCASTQLSRKEPGLLLNAAAYIANSMKLLVNPRSSELQQALDFARYVTRAYDPRVAGALNPFRRSHFNAEWFAAGGWHPVDASNYTLALRAATARVQATLPPIPTAGTLQYTINEFARRLVGLVQADGQRADPASIDVTALLREMDALLEVRFQDQGYSMKAVESALRRALSLPQLEEPHQTRGLSPAIIAGIAVCSAGLCLALAIVLVQLTLRRREYNRAPSDPTVPFAVFFLAMKNESAVRDSFGSDADDVVIPTLRKLVTRAARNYNCVAARHIDAHHMLVARDPADAMRCAEAIVKSVNEYAWPAVHRHTAGSVHAAAGETERVPALPGGRNSISVLSSHSKLAARDVTIRELSSVACRSRIPVVSVGLEFSLGRIDHEEATARQFFYSGPPVAAAAYLADVAPAGAVAMRNDVGSEIRKRGFKLSESPTRDFMDSQDAASVASAQLSRGLGTGALTSPQLAAVGNTTEPVDVLYYYVIDNWADSARKGWRAADTDSAMSHEGADDVDDTQTTGGLAAALQQASGALAVRRAAVYAINVPALRGPAGPTYSASTAEIAANVAEVLSGIAAEARAACLSATDGLFLFAVNAVVPTMRPADRAIAAAHESLAKLRLHGVAAGAGVGVGTAAVGELPWRCPRQAKAVTHPTVHGTACEHARLLALAAESWVKCTAQSPAQNHHLVFGGPSVEMNCTACVMEIMGLLLMPFPSKSPATSGGVNQRPICVGAVSVANANTEDEWMYQLDAAQNNVAFADTNELFRGLVREPPVVPKTQESHSTPEPLGSVRLAALLRQLRAIGEAADASGQVAVSWSSSSEAVRALAAVEVQKIHVDAGGAAIPVLISDCV